MENHDERDRVTHDVIGAAFEVHRELGFGFLEKVYQRAMQAELKPRKNMSHRLTQMDTDKFIFEFRRVDFRFYLCPSVLICGL